MKRLIEARKRACLTQAQVAEKIGVSRTTYVKYETGDISIPSDSLVNIAKVLNTSIDYIVGLSDTDLLHDELDKKTDNEIKNEILKNMTGASDNQLRSVLQYLKFTRSESGE